MLARRVEEGSRRSRDWDSGRLMRCSTISRQQLGLGLGKVAQPLRVAVSGTAVFSARSNATLALLGRRAACAAH